LLGGALLVWVVPNLMEAFTLVTTVAAILFMCVWSLIVLSYLAYRRHRAHLHAVSQFKMPGGVLMCWLCLAFFAAIVVLLSLEDDTRQALMVTPLWFVVMGGAYGMVLRKRQRGNGPDGSPEHGS
jgi:D-serine/D-alanine/glycine transporter